ncbi:MAG: Gfo/Idh/MocA family protein [Monoglobaceae bacterium]
MKIAFAGLRHEHIFVLYEMAKNNPLYEIVGAFESDDNGKKYAESKGVVCNYESYEQMLDDKNVDVIALGGCYGDRGEMAILALKAQKHVIADKPLCTRISELDEIEMLSKKANRCVSCMFTMRFEPKITAAKELIENGVLGEIGNVYFGGQHPLRFGKRPMWYFEAEKHGGVITDIAIHGIDVLSYIAGFKTEEIVAARSWNKYSEVEKNFKDSAQFMLTAPNNAGIIADVSYAIPDGIEFDLPYYWQFYIWGTKGVLSFSLNEKNSYYYVVNNKEPILLNEKKAENDYLTDFYNGMQKKPAILSSGDVFASMRMTLKIQNFAES